MGLLTVNRMAALAIAGLLCACAATAPASRDKKDATLFSPRKPDVAQPAASDDNAGVEPALDLEGAVRQAQAQRKAGDVTAATHTLSQLVLVAPDDPRVLGEYGKTLVVQGRSDDALAFLERAVELQPADWSLFSAQGVAFDQKGQYVQAQAAYARALAIKPGEPSVLSNSALSHIQSGNLDMAERELQEAAGAGGDYPRISSNLALVRSLRSSRAASTVPSRVTVQSSPSPATSAGQSAEPPVPQVPAPQALPAEPSATIAQSPAETAPQGLPGPMVQPGTEPVRAANAAPRIMMQKVPVDPLAGPVAPKRTAAVKKRVAPKTQQADAAPLRRAVDDRQASVEQ